MRDITRRLRILRAGCALTQRETALRARLPYGRYVTIEQGYRPPTADELARLARVLKTTAAVITSAVPVLFDAAS